MKKINLLLPREKLSNPKLSNLLLPREKHSDLLLPLLQERGEDPAGTDAEIERLRLGAGEHASVLEESHPLYYTHM